MKKYVVTMSQEFHVKAKNEEDAEEKAVEICAEDPECIMPHNMIIDVSISKLPDSFFD